MSRPLALWIPALFAATIACRAAPRATVGVPTDPPAAAHEQDFPEGLAPDELPPGGVFVPPQITTSSDVIVHGPAFMLDAGQSGRFGPYLYDEGGHVGSGTSRYVIVPSPDNAFSLKSVATGTLHGPFVFARGSPVALGRTTFTIETLPPLIYGRISHSRLTGTRVPVRLIALTPTAFRDLMAVRAEFEHIQTEYNTKTAPIRLRTPTIQGPAGFNRSQYIERSDQDVERAARWASQRALTALDRYARTRNTATMSTGPDMTFRFSAPAPGVYAVCAVSTARSTAPGHALTEPVIWWAHIRVDQASLEVIFDEKTAVPWQGLFHEQ